MMITCEKAEKLVIQNLDTAELRQHLTGCSPCRQFQSDYEKIKKLSFEISENSVDVPISNDLLVLKYAHDNMNQENVTHKKKIFTVWFTSAAAVQVLFFCILILQGYPVKQSSVYGNRSRHQEQALVEYPLDSDTQLMDDVVSFSLDLDYSSNYDTLCFCETVLNQLNDDAEYLCCAY